ncbi:COPII coat assembly protein [Phytophthora megakarya]|uniref:Protein transport protein sec16 n=1 Tax=Phytophthora megakarya TaxID=4795 RepID=A0A225WAY9_9STRA|nr:COPII coat assembly protein [Phytophthora megakarya]
MDGDRGFFASTPASGAPPGAGATRARPVSAGTRLRQKTVNAAAHQDFFASLGIDNASRGRTGSSASSSSNRSYNSMTMRPASASATGSSTSSSSGWRPPPIGGLGTQRAAPPAPAVGSLSVAAIQKSVTSTSSTSATALETPKVSDAVDAGKTSTSVTTGSKPTQLFSIEDAEDLYSDDGWNCDSPSTVLSNPMEEQANTMEQPVAVAEFAWGDDDDAFASPVAKTAQPTPFAVPSSTSEFETKMETTKPPPPHSAAVPPSSFTANEFEMKSSVAAQVSQETRSMFEQKIGSAAPPSAMASTFSSEMTQSTKGFSTMQVPPVETFGHESTQITTSVGASVSDESLRQDQQWNEGWDQHDKSVAKTEYTTTNTASPTTTAMPTIQTDAFVVPPVELTSPGGAAGEFWGDDDEDELFDHDDHADEEWDESVKSSVQNMELNLTEKSHAESVLTPSSSQDAAFSLLPQPPPPSPAVKDIIKEDVSMPVVQESVCVSSSYSLPGHSEDVQISSYEANIHTVTEGTTGKSPLEVKQSPVKFDSAEDNDEVKQTKSLNIDYSPFSSSIAESVSPDSDPNIFPEVPNSARFLHTPTGAGGPFGRVPSPGNNSTGFQNEFANAAVSTDHDHQQTTHNLTSEEKGEAQDSATDLSVRWNQSSLDRPGPMSPEERSSSHNDETHHNAHQGQSDEEERDSVVSFSGENSFFPPAGRPSSLYGGSQSSFASHRMYQSSIASTDHDGSSIASFGVSSAGATFGGSERVSEGGAFSDGTVSETPSMVDSSNASTAFGTDFPSVSEGQFSAPGTTIGGSDNASDGGFSDGNGSETTSMCESVNTNPRFVSEFSASSGHYVTETVERRDIQEPFESTAPQSDSAADFEDSTPATEASMFGGDDSSADVNPFANAPSAFPPVTSTDSSFQRQSEGVDLQEENIQNAASLFGATAGADVPNPFSSFGVSSAAPFAEEKTVEEHELSTSDAGELFGSGTSNDFESPFAQQTHYNSTDPFASRGAQHDFKNSATSADGMFSTGNDHSASSASLQFGAAGQASADSVFGGKSRSNNAATGAGHFGQQSNTPNAFYGGDPNYNQYAQSTATTYAEQGSAGISDHFGQQPTPGGSTYAQSPANTYRGQSYGQGSEVAVGASTANTTTSGAFGNISRQSSTSSFTTHAAQRETNALDVQNRYDRQVPDNYSRTSAVSTFARPGTQPIATSGTPDNYSHHSTAEVFGSASPAQRSTSGNHDYNYPQNGQNPGHSGAFGSHTPSSSNASADAFFGRSFATTPGTSSAYGGDRVSTPSSKMPLKAHEQPSFSRSLSNASSYGDQHGVHTSYNSSENSNLSRHPSSSSMSRYWHEESISSRASFDANPYVMRTPSATTGVTASSFFSSSASQDSSEMRTGQVGSLPHQEQTQQHQQYSRANLNHTESSVEYGGANTAISAAATVEANAIPDIGSVNAGRIPPATPNMQDESINYGESSASISADFSANAKRQDPSSGASEHDVNQPQAFNGFADSSAQAFGEQSSSDFFSSSPAPASCAAAATSQYQFQQESYNHEQQQQEQHGVAATSLQYTESHTSYEHFNSGANTSYGESGAHAPAAHPSYLDSGVSGGGQSSSTNFSQYQMQSQQQFHQFQQQQQQQQPQPQLHSATGYGYHGGAGQTQPQGTGYNAVSHREYGTATGYGSTNLQQNPHRGTAFAVKTSSKYKDPCVAPPSCLASFGFGGNVVTMFPKRKLRLNIAGSGYRNSPRGAPPPSEFDNVGNGELRKGPVNVYSMSQLHPKEKEFEQMDMFPGPLTEDVSDDAILEYLDDRLNRCEAPLNATEVEDENDRLLLGVLRVLVKCNGKLRSDPGTLNPSDPDSPEAQLIALLSESSKRRSGSQLPTFPTPRKTHSVTPPDLMLKQANDLREQLLVGDRKGAVSTAMTAHMWPEAMLIASFTDKDEYRRVLRTYLDETYASGDPCRALFMSFADQQEKSVQEPKRLLQTNAEQAVDSLVLSGWVSHAQVLLANRTADTNKILTELGDRLWNEVNAVAAAHVCYLLAGIQVEAPIPSSKMALLGGDHRTPTEARFYVSPGAVQRTEIYEWAQKHSKGASANLMIPFQGYKLIYAMLLADHGKLDTAFKYVTSMLTVIKAVMATMKPGTSMYLEGMKNQLTVFDDRLRQHLGQDRVASVAASTSRGGSRKQGKWGLGSALSIMGKIVNRVVEGNDTGSAAPAGPTTATPDAAATSGPSSDKGKASPKFKNVKKPGRSKTPPPSGSGSAKGSGWLSGLSSFIATKMNPEAKVAKLGEQMEAYFDEETKRWVFPGEKAAEESAMPSAPPTGPMPGSAPGSIAAGMPPVGSNSAPGSMSSGPAPSDDPLSALMAPPPSHMLMKKDPLAAMMAPPSRPGMYGARRGGSTAQRKPPRPQFAVFKPSAAAPGPSGDQGE